MEKFNVPHRPADTGIVNELDTDAALRAIRGAVTPDVLAAMDDAGIEALRSRMVELRSATRHADVASAIDAVIDRCAADLRRRHSAPGSAFSAASIGLLAALSVVWGSVFLLVKQAVDRGMPTEWILLSRSAIGAAALWAVVSALDTRGRSTIDGSQPGMRDYAVVGLLSYVPFLLIVWGEHRVDTGIAGVINSSDPLWTAIILSIVAGRVTGSRNRWLGTFVGLAGVVGLIVVENGIVAHGAFTGYAAVVGSAALYAALGVFASLRMRGVSPYRVAAWGLTWATAFSVVPALATGGAPRITEALVADVVALGVGCSAFGYVLFYALVERAGAARAALVTYLMPIVALLWGVLILGERLSPLAVVAATVILTGIWLSERPDGSASPFEEKRGSELDGMPQAVERYDVAA